MHGHRYGLFQQVRQQLTTAVGQNWLVKNDGVGLHGCLASGVRDGAQRAYTSRLGAGELGCEGGIGKLAHLDAQHRELLCDGRGSGELHLGSGDCGGEHLADDVAQCEAFADAHAQLV